MSGILGNTIRSLLGDEFEKRAVWEKGAPIVGFDPAVWRRDRFGHAMKYSEYGQCSEHGWEKDHHMPSALGGSDRFSNLLPLHWKNNRAKGMRLV